MISSILRAGLVAVALCVLAGTAAAEGQWTSAETQSGGGPVLDVAPVQGIQEEPTLSRPGLRRCRQAGREPIVSRTIHIQRPSMRPST
jgi:hypothetical protein